MFSFLQSAGPYALEAQLKGHSSGINSLDVSPGGDFLASASGDGVKVWDLQTYRQMVHLPHDSLRGVASCVKWLTRRDDLYETVCYGTGSGYLSIVRQVPNEGTFKEQWCKRLATGEEIICIAIDMTHESVTRIAIGTRSKIVQLFKLDRRGKVQAVFSVQLEKTVPAGLAFARNDVKDIFVFGLFDGQIHTLSGNDGKTLSTMSVGGIMANVAVNEQQKYFVVDNMVKGFSLHSLDNGSWKRSFAINKTSSKLTSLLPRQVAFVEGSGAIAGGSDHGAAYVFDRRTASILQVLHHGSRDIVQTVTTHDKKNISMIVTATSSINCKNPTIRVWLRKHPKTPQPPKNGQKKPAVLIPISRLAHYLMVLATLLFLFQNIPVPENWMRHVIAWTQLVPSVPGRWPLVWIRDPSTGNGFPATNTLADVGMAPDRRARATYAADTVRISLEERCSGMKVDGRTDRHMHSARTSSDTERPFAAEVVVGDAVGDDNARLTAQSTGTDDLMYGDVVTEEALLVVSSHCKITDGLV